MSKQYIADKFIILSWHTSSLAAFPLPVHSCISQFIIAEIRSYHAFHIGLASLWVSFMQKLDLGIYTVALHYHSRLRCSNIIHMTNASMSFSSMHFAK